PARYCFPGVACGGSGSVAGSAVSSSSTPDGSNPNRPYQLFVFDPSGVLLELTADPATEPEPPQATPGKQYRAGHRDWFVPQAYRQFGAA
ncbi:MAG TPA: hypothetical protein VM491_04470, partial [Burkholderiaceae bacterium]|nr:hypothetical protein [Burkholderiaceae bacterium]